MNKKQVAIIVSLLVLIICAGVLATKVNSPFSVASSDMGTSKSKSTASTDTSKSTEDDYFTEARLARDQVTSKTVETLKTIIDDKNTTKESKDNAASKSTLIQAQSVNQNKIETILKGKGYDEAVCTIDDENKATIILKSKQKLTDVQSRDIKNVIMSVVKVNDIDIIVKA